LICWLTVHLNLTFIRSSCRHCAGTIIRRRKKLFLNTQVYKALPNWYKKYNFCSRCIRNVFAYNVLGNKRIKTSLIFKVPFTFLLYRKIVLGAYSCTSYDWKYVSSSTRILMSIMKNDLWFYINWKAIHFFYAL